jgi:hypothetical protein
MCTAVSLSTCAPKPGLSHFGSCAGKGGRERARERARARGREKDRGNGRGSEVGGREREREGGRERSIREGTCTAKAARVFSLHPSLPLTLSGPTHPHTPGADPPTHTHLVQTRLRGGFSRIVSIALVPPPPPHLVIILPPVNVSPIITIRRTIRGGIPCVLLLGRSPRRVLLPFRLLWMVYVDVEPEFDCTLFRFESLGFRV